MVHIFKCTEDVSKNTYCMFKAHIEPVTTDHKEENLRYTILSLQREKKMMMQLSPEDSQNWKQQNTPIHKNLQQHKPIYNLLSNATKIPMYNTAFIRNIEQITISETKCSVYCTEKKKKLLKMFKDIHRSMPRPSPMFCERPD